MTYVEGCSVEQGLMEKAVSPEVISLAISHVKKNKGAPGIDGKTVDELDELWSAHGARICQVLVAGDYIPRPVRQKLIPKPDGGERMLGIPTVLDRLVQTMLVLVLEPLFEPHFSDSSYGFRPGRSQYMAVAKAKEYVVSGLEWVADIDLEKFFDRVNHDVLMSRVSRRVTDKRVLKLLRRFLTCGMMINGVAIETEEGTPQGGPLSPLLSNVMLDDLDKELERRGHRFVRFADDCNIYTGSEFAARRVLESVTRFLEVKLRLKVNRDKSAAALTSERRFLGFTLVKLKEKVYVRLSAKAIKRFKSKVRIITRRVRRIRSKLMLSELNAYLTGWANYFAKAGGIQAQLTSLDGWIRRRIRHGSGWSGRPRASVGPIS